MKFTENTIFHIYNQGNNRQPIFFKDENYLFFLKKMRDYLLPYGDLLCYCLMPNHFHWLMYVRNLSQEVTNPGESSEAVTPSHRLTTPRQRNLNDSIAILLRSYTRAINLQENRSGSLFRKETKAKDGWEDVTLCPSHVNYGKVLQNWELYGPTCFNYIHNNPIEANLVVRSEDWVYSSASDFAGLRKGTLCNQNLAKELLFFT